MKLCINCVHHDVGSTTPIHRCFRLGKMGAISPVTGETEDSRGWEPCYIERSEAAPYHHERCGPHGRFWVLRDDPR